MLFNSYVFVLAFLPIVLIGYFLLCKVNSLFSRIFLLGMSLFFYGYFNIHYTIIIVISILFNFSVGKLLQIKNKKTILIIGLFLNIGVLFYYKYYDFFIENINKFFHTSFTLNNLLLPLGISFFTFQQLSYLLDVHRDPSINYNFIDYALFVTYFPQLIAGPIVTHDELIPQFRNPQNRKINFKNFSAGLMAFSFGLAKKVLLADIFGHVVDAAYSKVNSLSAIMVIIVLLSYTFQIYFDFSGYCDMASGISLMFNIKLPMNFNSPYQSITILDFWKRWHMTLTRFFTKYLYIPLGGNRHGKFRTCLNIFIVFLISGLWHGANWTFILWGISHGIFSILNQMFKKNIQKIPTAINWMITFIFVNITWALFRSNSIKHFKQLFQALLSSKQMLFDWTILYHFQTPEIKIITRILKNIIGTNKVSMFACVFFIGLSFLFVLKFKNTNQRIDIFKPTKKYLFVTVFLLISSILSFSNVGLFLYFNF